MSHEHTPPQHWTYRVEATPVQPPAAAHQPEPNNALALLNMMVSMQNHLLDLQRQSLEIQKEQLGLTRELVMVGREQRARQAAELERWQNSHGDHLDALRETLSQLEQVHAALMGDLAENVADNFENLLEGDFSLSDFVDRYGPRLAHLNTVLAVLRPLTIVLNPGKKAEE